MLYLLRDTTRVNKSFKGQFPFLIKLSEKAYDWKFLTTCYC